MTFTITKTKFAIALVVVAMLVPATAMATHVFDDVPDDKFYAVPVEWAFDNGITTGKSPTTFAPDDNVTRGESVTFLKRYNDNLVEPALDALEADTESRVAGVQDPTFDNLVTITSIDHVAVLTLTVDSGATRDVALNAHVYLERGGSTSGRYEVELRVTDCAGSVVGASFWRPPISTSSFVADSVSITGFAPDTASGTTFALCIRKFDGGAPNVTASGRGLIATW